MTPSWGDVGWPTAVFPHKEELKMRVLTIPGAAIRELFRSCTQPGVKAGGR
jgi:hypothetical protein